MQSMRVRWIRLALAASLVPALSASLAFLILAFAEPEMFQPREGLLQRAVGVLPIAPFAAAYGAVGAFLFLLPFFLVASLIGRRITYVAAGACAGATHAFAGFVSHGSGIGLVEALALIGGFWPYAALDPSFGKTLALCSVIAGGVAGLAYAPKGQRAAVKPCDQAGGRRS